MIDVKNDTRTEVVCNVLSSTSESYGKSVWHHDPNNICPAPPRHTLPTALPHDRTTGTMNPRQQIVRLPNSLTKSKNKNTTKYSN